MFLQNCWYVAAWSKDIGRELRAEAYLGENVVLYRQEDGTPVALENACPHRKLPLSDGNLKGDHVECGYHGLTFDCAGTCVAAPTQADAIPRRAVVKSYPVVDRYRLLWIWMGDPELANEDDIYDFPPLSDKGNWKGFEKEAYLHYDANWLLIVDNLSDFSHVAFVHTNTLGGSEAYAYNTIPENIEKLDNGFSNTQKVCD